MTAQRGTSIVLAISILILLLGSSILTGFPFKLQLFAPGSAQQFNQGTSWNFHSQIASQTQPPPGVAGSIQCSFTNNCAILQNYPSTSTFGYTSMAMAQSSIYFPYFPSGASQPDFSIALGNPPTSGPSTIQTSVTSSILHILNCIQGSGSPDLNSWCTTEGSLLTNQNSTCACVLITLKYTSSVTADGSTNYLYPNGTTVPKGTIIWTIKTVQYYLYRFIATINIATQNDLPAVSVIAPYCPFFGPCVTNTWTQKGANDWVFGSTVANDYNAFGTDIGYINQYNKFTGVINVNLNIPAQFVSSSTDWYGFLGAWTTQTPWNVNCALGGPSPAGTCGNSAVQGVVQEALSHIQLQLFKDPGFIQQASGILSPSTPSTSTYNASALDQSFRNTLSNSVYFPVYVNGFGTGYNLIGTCQIGCATATQEVYWNTPTGTFSFTYDVLSVNKPNFLTYYQLNTSPPSQCPTCVYLSGQVTGLFGAGIGGVAIQASGSTSGAVTGSAITNNAGYWNASGAAGSLTLKFTTNGWYDGQTLTFNAQLGHYYYFPIVLQIDFWVWIGVIALGLIVIALVVTWSITTTLLRKGIRIGGR